jgi:regulator of sirC expression with transglutaminase-like and TPR domain
MFFFCSADSLGSGRSSVPHPSAQLAPPAPPPGPPAARPSPDPVEIVRAVLAEHEARLDYAAAKLALDAAVEPGQDRAAAERMLDGFTATATLMAGAQASIESKLVALRRMLYEPGPWNGRRPFVYDPDDPSGERVANKLLANYLTTRRGNCVSMPILFLILAGRLGLEAGLATAPLHIFVRCHVEGGREINIEATSGGHPARDSWIRQTMPMSDLAVASGLYMRTLGRREAVALMATTVLEHLGDEGRYEQAIAVADIILRHNPRDAYSMVKQGTACAALMRQELERYGSVFLIPPLRRARYLDLARRNRAAFEAAEALGWEPVE